MFTRFVECHVKPDKKDDFTHQLRNDVLPILQKQPGFVDLIGLVSENDPGADCFGQLLEHQAGRGALPSRALQPHFRDAQAQPETRPCGGYFQRGYLDRPPHRGWEGRLILAAPAGRNQVPGQFSVTSRTTA